MEDIEWVFECADVNNDGDVDRGELQRYFADSEDELADLKARPGPNLVGV